MNNLLHITSRRSTIRTVKGWLVYGKSASVPNYHPKYPTKAFTSKVRADEFADFMRNDKILEGEDISIEVMAIDIDINLENIPCPEVLSEE